MNACNRLVNERNEGRRHARHIDALDHSRAVSDHKPPMDHPHLRDNSNARKMQEARSAEIQLENRILLQKMLTIDTKPSQFSAENYSARSAPPPNRSLHGEKQRRELDRITTANQNLLNRLQTAKPSIDVRGWEEEEMDRQALRYRLSQNSCRGRALKLPMPAPRGAIADVQQLPRLGSQSARFHEDDWARLSNNELDQRLL